MGIDRAIDITAEQRKTVLVLLQRHLPNTTAWVYGSRAQWTTRPQSDLDMVVFATPEQNSRVSDLREAFEESNLPFRVDLFVWDEVPEQFREQIEAEHVVLVEEEELGMSNDGWVSLRLGDVCTKIGSGATPRGGKEVYLKDGLCALIRSQNVYNNRFSHDGLAFINQQQAIELNNVEVFADDVLLNITGDSVARACQVAPDVLPARVNQHVAIIRPDPNKLSPHFLRYFLVCPEIQTMLLSWAGSGGTRNALTKGMIESFDVQAPINMAEQRAIAHILGTLDDKIELNRRMNETLEEMARALFKSWFVDFLPVRAKQRARTQTGDPVRAKAALITPPLRGSDGTVERARAYLPAARGLAQAGLAGMDDSIADLFPDRLVDSELGPIPEGWEVKALGECFNLTMGQSPPGSTYNQHAEGTPFFQGRTDFGFRYPERRRYCTAPTRIAEPDDTLVSVRAPVGDINMAWERCCIGRGVAALRHKSASSSFTYYSAWVIQGEISEYEHTGTVFGAINKRQFEALQTVEPRPELIEAFDARVGPIDARIRRNISEARILTFVRDTLLPKLVSGEVRTSNVSMGIIQQ